MGISVQVPGVGNASGSISPCGTRRGCGSRKPRSSSNRCHVDAKGGRPQADVKVQGASLSRPPWGQNLRDRWLEPGPGSGAPRRSQGKAGAQPVCMHRAPGGAFSPVTPRLLLPLTPTPEERVLDAPQTSVHTSRCPTKSLVHTSQPPPPRPTLRNKGSSRMPRDEVWSSQLQSTLSHGAPLSMVEQKMGSMKPTHKTLHTKKYKI